jgi:hypothetical protein
MLYLIGKKKWDNLQELIHEGAFEDVVMDSFEMSKIIAFAVNLQIPIPILHLLCDLNPDALTVSDVPFHLARRQSQNSQTIRVGVYSTKGGSFPWTKQFVVPVIILRFLISFYSTIIFSKATIVDLCIGICSRGLR